MIRSFADKAAEGLYVTGKGGKLPPDILEAALRKLDYLDSAVTLHDLRVPPGNRLEALKGKYKGKHSIRINDQFRLVFRFEGRDAFDVEIVDYH
ncbi:MAG: type II toxin-antitoxin system RelE/ParE family toxin [Thermodesulfovibrionales bacterium]|nr:type II toxin-antitoxin system RelE/ParE family toxin [Thermodesulfovibrionales bacterium]